MDSHNTTYRLITALLGLIFLASASFPTGLHAHESAAENCMPLTNVHADVHSDHCDLRDHQETSSPEEGHDHYNGECDLVFACACKAGQAAVTPQAHLTLVKYEAILPTVETDFLVALKPSIPPAEQQRSAKVASPPPIFLLNSTFLN